MPFLDEFMKIATRFTECLVIVRHSSRFHHFKDCSCSCGDFWGLGTESGIAIIFKWWPHHVAHYCPVGSGSPALKIHVRAYIERLAIQVNNVMLLTPFDVISAVSSELCIANGSTDVGPWSSEQTEWPTQLLSCTVVVSCISLLQYMWISQPSP